MGKKKNKKHAFREVTVTAVWVKNKWSRYLVPGWTD